MRSRSYEVRPLAMTPAPLTGQTLGSYRVLDKIGQGGMGVVYLGEHVLIGRTVAIKVLLPSVTTDASLVRRFFNEARASAQVRHPGIVNVLDFGISGEGTVYLVMEHLEGESLRARMDRDGALEETAVRRLGRQVASALAAAHARQIIHRDLKPDNLFLVPDEQILGGQRVKVLDFGVAKLLTRPGGGAVETRSGAILGSPAYMSPEQVRGHGLIDERADVYSLGCVLFEMIAGRRPFVAPGFAEVMAMHMFTPAPSARLFAPDISSELEAIIERMLTKEPENRPASMDEVISALDQAADERGAPLPAKKPATRPTIGDTLAGPRQVSPPELDAATVCGPVEGNLADVSVGSSSVAGASVADRAHDRPPAPPLHRRAAIASAILLLAAGAGGLAFLWRSRTEVQGPAAPADQGRPAVSPPLTAPASPGPTTSSQPPASVSPPESVSSPASVSPPDAMAEPKPTPAVRRDAGPSSAPADAGHARPRPRGQKRPRQKPKLERGQLIDE